LLNFGQYSKNFKNGQYLTIGKIISINPFPEKSEETWAID